MEKKDLPEFLWPRLRLFLSVDLVGSTALKQAGEFPIERPAGDETLERAGPKWIFDLASFYREILAKFNYEWKRYCDEIADKERWPKDAKAVLWKINGDELIFAQILTSSKHCIALLYCWMRACQAYRAELCSKGSKLDVKLTAWAAGFPLTNTEVIFQKYNDIQYDDSDPIFIHYDLLRRWYAEPESREKLVQDFIGPSIDTGFRLAAKATPRKFTISIEVAYMLSVTAIPKPLEMKLYFDGHETLKGVFGGKPYPIFWIDTHGEDVLSIAEDKLTKIEHQNRESVRNYCESFFEKYSSFMIRPFINEDSEPAMTEIPTHYSEKLHFLAKKCRDATENKKSYDTSLEMARSQPEEKVETTIIIALPEADPVSTSE